MSHKYNLVNRDTDEVYKTNIELSPWEVETLNNGYNLNFCPKRYVLSPDYVPEDAEEVELFKFTQPI